MEYRHPHQPSGTPGAPVPEQVPERLEDALQYTAFYSVPPVSVLPQILSGPELVPQVASFQLPEQDGRPAIYDGVSSDRAAAAPFTQYLSSISNSAITYQLPVELSNLPSSGVDMASQIRQLNLSPMAEEVLLSVSPSFSLIPTAPPPPRKQRGLSRANQMAPPVSGPLPVSVPPQVLMQPAGDSTGSMASMPGPMATPPRPTGYPMGTPGQPLYSDVTMSPSFANTSATMANTSLDTTIVPSPLRSSPPKGEYVLQYGHLGAGADPILSAPTVPAPPGGRSNSGTASPRKRKIKDDEDAYPKLEDPKKKGRLAVTQLQNMIEAIIEADDALAQDTSGAGPDQSSAIWLAQTHMDREPSVANDILIRLDGALLRAETLGVYGEIDIDELTRIQKVVCRNITRGNSIDWKSALEDIDSLDEATVLVDNSLKACKVILRTMLGGREEKQICSEDTIAELVEFLNSIVDGYVLPLANTLAMNQYRHFLDRKKILVGILHEATRTVWTLSQLVAKEDMNENVITRLEYMSIKIIFLENATKEKDSMFGVVNVENLRVAIMDLISQIFSTYPDQRTFVIDEILTSLETLPVNRLDARQFKLVGGGNIQLVSALILRLVQTAATLDTRTLQVSSSLHNTAPDDPSVELQRREEFVATSLQCNSEAAKCAADVVNFLIDRAMKSTKSGEAPYRALLDLFAEDFIAVLESPQWPAAELLLRRLTMSMISLADGDKNSAHVTSMALDILGTVGAKLCALKKQASPLPDLSMLSTTADLKAFNDASNEILAYLRKAKSADAAVKSAYGYFLSEWVSIVNNLSTSEPTATSEEVRNIIKQLMWSILDESWISKNEVSDDNYATTIAVYSQILLSLPLLKTYDRLLAEVLRSLDHSRINSRSKALRVLNIILARDPEVLANPSVMASVGARLRDSSALVRDAAVDVVGKYVLVRPEFIETFYPLLCERSGDTGPGVRKRVLKLLKDIYMFPSANQTIRAEIADRFLKRLEDEEESIIALSKKTLEEIWIQPLMLSVGSGSDELQTNAEIDVRLRVMLETRRKGEKTAKMMLVFLQDMFDERESPVPAPFVNAARMIVERLLDYIVNRQDDEEDSLQDLLGMLSIFAVVHPRLFTPEQLVALQSYFQDDRAKEDLSVYYLLLIFRNVLPLSNIINTKYLTEMQQSLLKMLSKMNLRELSEGMPCLWEVSAMLKDTRRLAVTATSCLKAITPYIVKIVKNVALTIDAKLIRLLHLLGNFGRFCELDEYVGMFRTIVKGIGLQNSKTTTDVLVGTLLLFADAKLSPAIRRIAVRNLGIIAISHPHVFVAEGVLKVLDDVMKGKDQELKDTFVKVLNEFLTSEQEKADKASKEKVDEKDGVDIGVLQGNTRIFVNDGVCTSLVQRHLMAIIDITLRSEDDYAFAAILLLDRIVRQGFANPRNCVPAIIALETSDVKAIRMLAHELHKRLHAKHESLIEGCYVDGVKRTVQYRRAVGGLERSMMANSLSLMYSVIKGNRMSRRKFLQALVRSLDFDLLKMRKSAAFAQLLARHLEYVAFVVQSFSSLDYGVTEEVYIVVHSLDRILNGTGVSILFFLTEWQAAAGARPELAAAEANDAAVLVDSAGDVRLSLRELAMCSAVMYMVYVLQAHLKRLYALNEQTCKTFQPSKLPKDTKSASRVANVPPQLDPGQYPWTHAGFDAAVPNQHLLAVVREFLSATDAAMI
ncbi:sister chromatid cohesion C-terminus-domain-containing protein [Dipodascopsis tothii]|uniref:sister chromatid cohesion C-terminus-domain-containing protein n=1 Tax=Dipodascopsis tothii TaxID=44089 RepID=UPI0034CD7E61